MTLDQEAAIYGMERHYGESDQAFEQRIDHTCADNEPTLREVLGRKSTYPTPADQADTDCNEPPRLRDYPMILVLWVAMILMAIGVAIHALYVYLRDTIADNRDIIMTAGLSIVILLVGAVVIGINCHN